MLRRLSIRHFALIDHIEWTVADGWSVLTGETGSGKSILLGALGLVLGDRAEGIEIREDNLHDFVGKPVFSQGKWIFLVQARIKYTNTSKLGNICAEEPFTNFETHQLRGS